MDNKIRHSGIVDSVSENMVKVRILQTSACAACKVASHCNASESKEKLIDVKVSDGKGYKVGDAVTVCASRNIFSRAVILAFALPLCLMVGALVTVMLLTHDDGLAGLSSVAVLIPYFLLVWLFRNRISRQVSFTLDD